MATYTTKLNLKKPVGTEDINVNDINGNSDILDAAFAALDPYSLGNFTTLADLENALVTYSNTYMKTHEVKTVYAGTSAFGYFTTTTYNFMVRRLDSNRCNVMAFRGNNIEIIVGNCLNGTWTWDKLVLSTSVSGTISAGTKASFTFSSCQIIGKLCVFSMYATTTSAASAGDVLCSFSGITAKVRTDYIVPTSNGDKLFYLASGSNQIKFNGSCASGVVVALSGSFVIN